MPLAPLVATLLIVVAAALAKHLLLARPGLPTWPAYARTGLVGSPVRELARALVCVFTGLRITHLRLYARNDADGTLGRLHYAYFPTALGYLGRTLEGLAPYAAGCLLLGLGTDLGLWVDAPPANWTQLAGWLPAALSAVLHGLLGMPGQGTPALLLLVGVLLVALHALPTPGDLRRMGHGLLMAVPLGLFVGALLWLVREARFPYVEGLFRRLEDSLLPALHNAVAWLAVTGLALVVAAALAALLGVLLPTLLGALLRRLLPRRTGSANPER